MGKSSKKSKSDRINALRKQYDAFLEEDKKRKDRNEYILGRMETMRACTALVHVRSKAYPKLDECDYTTQPKYRSSMAHLSNSAIPLSGQKHAAPKYLNKNDDEPSLLREISKKYFLIPKVISNVSLNDRDQSPIDDTDWKNKYNILEELKREEKYDQPNTSIYKKQNYDLNDPYKDNKNAEYIPQESKEKSTAQNNSTLSLELTPSKLQRNMFSNIELSNSKLKPNQSKQKQIDETLNGENIGETDLNMIKQELVPQSNKLHEVNLPAHNLLPKVAQVENNIKQDTMLISTNNKINEIKESNELPEEKLTSEMEPIEALENNKYLPEENNCVEFNESQNNTVHYARNNGNNNLSPIVNNENTIQVNNENTIQVNNENTIQVNNENTIQVNNENTIQVNNENTIQVNNEYTMEANNENNTFSVKNIEDNQEFVHNENIVRAQGVYEKVAGHLQDDPAIDITGHQEYQVQGPDLNQIKNVEQNITSEVNDELETEQKEMFYNEDNDKNNEYNENDDTTPYTAENENYVNEEYSYYDESQKEQIYPTEINEHEEATERYDPNYEKQYVNNYEDTMDTQYQPEQYNVENSYEQQQNMYDHTAELQQGNVNYQPENPNYEYAPTENVKDAEVNENVYYTNSPQETAQYEAQQLENPEIANQQNIAYTTSDDYDAQQEYITMHAEPLQIENVEQQLDIEDGYIPNSNIVAENQDYQEVIEETTPEIQQTDITVT